MRRRLLARLFVAKLWLLLAVGGTVVAGAALAPLGGYRVLTVTSGSMAPAIAAGDAVLVEQIPARSAQAGDVVTFRNPADATELVTHRVVRARPAGDRIEFATRGDANDGVERWGTAADGRIGLVRQRVEKLGYALVWLRSIYGLLVLLVLPLALLATRLLVTIWRGPRGVRPRVARALARGPLALIALSALLAQTGASAAAFTSTTANPASSFAAERIFSAERTTATWSVRDRSDLLRGEVDVSTASAFAGDGLIVTTANWGTAYSSTRYLDVDVNASLPAGLATSAVQLNLDLASTGGNTTCFYFEVLRVSTGALLGTHGAPGSDVACATGTTFVPTATALTEVTSSDLANDLRVRIYMKNTAGGKARVDRATVTGSTPYAPFVLYEQKRNDVDGTPGTPTTVPLAAADGVSLTSLSAWDVAFTSSAYLRFVFPSYLPAGAVVTNATFTFRHRSNAFLAPGACYYFELYSGTTLLGTYGSAGSPFCNNTSAFATRTHTLTQITSGSQGNDVRVKMFVRDSGSSTTSVDQATLALTYYLD